VMMLVIMMIIVMPLPFVRAVRWRLESSVRR
jgi:hypothetical protein